MLLTTRDNKQIENRPEALILIVAPALTVIVALQVVAFGEFQGLEAWHIAPARLWNIHKRVMGKVFQNAINLKVFAQRLKTRSATRNVCKTTRFHEVGGELLESVRKLFH